MSVSLPGNPGSAAGLRSDTDFMAFLSSFTEEGLDERSLIHDVDNQWLCGKLNLPLIAGETVDSLQAELDQVGSRDLVFKHLGCLAEGGSKKAFQNFVQAYQRSNLSTHIPLETYLDVWDPDGLTLLHRAVKSRNLEAVEALIQVGAPTDAMDAQQMTPLIRSWLFGLHYFFHSRSGCSRAVKLAAISERLQAVEGTSSREYLYRKLLAQIFGVEGSSEMGDCTFPLEGIQALFPLKAALESASPFYTGLYSTLVCPDREPWDTICAKLNPSYLGLIEEKRDAILGALTAIPELLYKSIRYRADPNILDRLKPGEPLPLVGGWPGHMIGGVVTPYEHKSAFSTQSEIRYEFLVCNRGEYHTSWGRYEPGVQAFRTDRKGAGEVVAHWANQLKHLQESLVKEEREIASYTQTPINESMDGELIAEQFLHTQGIVDAWAAHLMAPPRRCYVDTFSAALLPQAAQVVGNCTWVNLQSMEMALVYQLLSPILPTDLAKELAQVLIGLREAEAQAFAAQDYLAFHLNGEDSKPYDARLLKEVMSQLEQNATSWKTSTLITAFKAMQAGLGKLNERR